VPNQPLPAGSIDTNKGLWLALNLAWEMGYLIAIPVLVLGIGGAYLDKYLATSPLFILSGFALAMLFSSVSVYRRVRAVLQS
jgi:F0F1-type ATP synthase assembly protein I